MSREGRTEQPSGHVSRAVLIGPVVPYRGGIAQHTTNLHRALTESIECLTISFVRQYPRFLFPGKSDRDSALGCHREKDVEYLIDSLNPLTWRRAVMRVKTYMPDIVIIPWWHAYWAPCFAYICLALRKLEVRFVFICHNAIEHEDRWWKRAAADAVLGNANRFIVHAASERDSLAKRFPGRETVVTPHPIAPQSPVPTTALARRGRLEVLFFGFVRPYKGLEVLLKAIALLRNEDIFVSIVGEFWSGREETRRFISDHSLEHRIELIDRYVSENEAAAYFSRCDVVVLPYHSATGSAVIALAYRARKPVIVTRVGGLPDVVRVGQTGLVIDPGSSEQLAEALAGVLKGDHSFTPEAIDDFAAEFTWAHFATVVLRS